MAFHFMEIPGLSRWIVRGAGKLFVSRFPDYERLRAIPAIAAIHYPSAPPRFIPIRPNIIPIRPNTGVPDEPVFGLLGWKVIPIGISQSIPTSSQSSQPPHSEVRASFSCPGFLITSDYGRFRRSRRFTSLYPLPISSRFIKSHQGLIKTPSRLPSRRHQRPLIKSVPKSGARRSAYSGSPDLPITRFQGAPPGVN
jgi:hypothetical protein